MSEELWQKENKTEEPMPEVTEEPIPETAEEPMPEATEEPMQETTEEPMQEALEEPSQEVSEEAVQEQSEESSPERTEISSESMTEGAEDISQAENTPYSLSEVEEELNFERKRMRRKKVAKRIIYALIIIAAVAVILSLLVVPVLRISGSSMTETLQDEDVVITVKTKNIERGDVIAFYYNNSILVKRVIATSGEWVNIDDDGTVYVNNKPLDESYVSEKALGECNIELPYQVPDDKIFVMGDHRATSIDSRNTAVGCVATDEILGKLEFRVWPLKNLGRIK